jgi:transposase-like protein
LELPVSSAQTGLAGQETEVTAKARRRQFTAEFKRKVLAEVDACTGAGEIGALLRREVLYSSHLVEWRRCALPTASVPATMRNVRWV